MFECKPSIEQIDDQSTDIQMCTQFSGEGRTAFPRLMQSWQVVLVLCDFV